MANDHCEAWGPLGRTFALWVAVAGCSKAPEPAQQAQPGPDCRALIATARGAVGCDPMLAALASALERDPDEIRCRRAVRGLLAEPSTEPGRVHSLFESVQPHPAHPLTDDEHARLRSLTFPGALTVIPDLPPGPGVPPTVASIDGAPLPTDDRGRLHAHLAPARHNLTVRHAGENNRYCVELDACDPLTVTAHGARLGVHPRVEQGPCSADGSTVSP